MERYGNRQGGWMNNPFGGGRSEEYQQRRDDMMQQRDDRQGQFQDRRNQMNDWRTQFKDWMGQRPDFGSLSGAMTPEWQAQMQTWQGQRPTDMSDAAARQQWLSSIPIPAGATGVQEWLAARPQMPNMASGYGGGGGGNWSMPTYNFANRPFRQPAQAAPQAANNAAPANTTPPAQNNAPPASNTPPPGWGNQNVGMLYRSRPNPWASRNPWNSGNS